MWSELSSKTTQNLMICAPAVCIEQGGYLGSAMDDYRHTVENEEGAPHPNKNSQPNQEVMKRTPKRCDNIALYS